MLVYKPREVGVAVPSHRIKQLPIARISQPLRVPRRPAEPVRAQDRIAVPVGHGRIPISLDTENIRSQVAQSSNEIIRGFFLEGCWVVPRRGINSMLPGRAEPRLSTVGVQADGLVAAWCVLGGGALNS